MPKTKKGEESVNYYIGFQKKHGFGRMVAKMKKDGVFHYHFKNGLELNDWLKVLFAITPGSSVYKWARERMFKKLRQTMEEEEVRIKKKYGRF